jgi:hypothetical protein
MLKKQINLIAGAALAGLIATTVTMTPLFAEDAKPAAASKPHIDLAFCIDTTGSMQGEIENVKAKTKELVAKLAGGKPTPVIRVGLVAFRDRGDSYVTKVFQFNEDIDKVVKDISSLQADGGGDTPEAVNQALHDSLTKLSWSPDKKTLKLLFLIGDAGPNKYPGDFDYRTEAKNAISRGIQINTLGCQGIENASEVDGAGVFKEIAKLADGRYESLAYHQEVIGADGKKTDVIASGGKLYKMKAGSARGASWKDGATALRERGAVDEVAEFAAAPPPPMAVAPASGFAAAAMADAPAFVGVRGGSLEAKRRSAPGRAYVRDYRAAETSPAMSISAGSVSRTDNNLADIVLKATKEAAAKKLNVDFTSK